MAKEQQERTDRTRPATPVWAQDAARMARWSVDDHLGNGSDLVAA